MTARRGWRRTALAACAALLAAVPLVAAPTLPADARAGESMYLQGVRASGEPLRGERGEGGAAVQGRNAACVSCHRHSGFGAMEGTSTIPPITGQFLFQPRMQGVDNSELPYVEGARGDRQPYTSGSLARAIREGIASDGRLLSPLMPRFALDDAEMASLTAYLNSLTKRQVPGVTDATLHFATIIAPGVEPARRAAFLAVMNQFVADKNAAARAVTPRLRSSRQMRFRIVRRWELHVWELKGPPSGWSAQLSARLAAEPVFAVLSGLGGDWAPVHRFCQSEAIPCLFPNVELPVVADDDFYSLYFSQAVLLDAALVAHQLRERAPSGRLLQVFRAGDIGEAAAAALARQSPATSVAARLPARREAGDLRSALAHAAAGDTLMLWLRPGDLAALGGIPPPTSGAGVYLSGVMGGLESAPLPAAWRPMAEMAYPVDLPERRRVRVDFAQGWFRLRHIAVVDLPMQADTYLALGLVSETLNRMSDSFVRDYLIERLEGMLEHRIITGYYPRLALAQRQRFASKGGYLVRFTGPGSTQVAADGPWTVP